VGYDDLDVARCQIRYPLTTISQPKEQVGRLAFDLIYKVIEKAEVASVVLKPELVVRAAPAPPPV
jgi:DNA-binding LacI/PurR family transcriptional regulator